MNIPAVRGSRIEDVPEGDVDYVLADPSRYLGTHANAVPLPANVQAARVFYGARFHNQALPLEHPDVPLVQTAVEGRSLEHELGGMSGRIHSKKAGTVSAITPDSIEVTDEAGEAHPHAIYNHFPFNRVTGIHSHPVVRPGDKVFPGDMLARSNFTDEKGTLALGANARIALAPYLGHSMDDATVISEDFAKRLASSHLEGYDHSLENGAKGGLGHFTSLFPRKYKTEQLKGMNEHGVVQPGTVVRKGDPLILATKPRSISSATAQLGLLSKSMREARQDASVTWDHEDPGKVIDSHQLKDGSVKLSVSVVRPTKVGDKLVLRSGSKGVVSLVIPQDRMPRSVDGQPFDMLLNPLTIPSRTNNAGVFELLLGKVAKKRGTPYVLPAFDSKRGSTHAFVQKELADNGVDAEEHLFDPALGQRLDAPVLTGIGHVLKLSHTSESKTSSRGVGGYDVNQQPAKGSGDAAQSKRMSGLESAALLSSGAYGVLKESSTLRGQRCFDPETQVLTKRGWVFWPDVTGDDLLLTRDKDNETSAWYEKPAQLVDQEYSGQLLGYEGKHLDWLVTPNHNFWGVRGAVSRKNAWRHKKNFSAGEVFGKDGNIDAFGFVYKGTISKDFVLKFNQESVPEAVRKVKSVEMSIIDYCRLIGWWGSEGCANIDKEGRGNIRISQTERVNGENCREIVSLLRRIGFDSISDQRQRKTHGLSSVVQSPVLFPGEVVGYRVRSRPLAEHLLSLGDRSWNKRLPDMVFEAPLEARLELLHCYTEGDGCVRESEGSKHSFITSCSKGMIEDLQRLALLSGMCAFIGDVTSGISRHPQYRLIFSNNLQELSFRKKPAAQFKGHYLQDYVGRIYCATMRTGLLYVRRNGKCMWSGNSDDYWRTLREGYTPAAPGAPFVFSKFRALLGGAGIRTHGANRSKLRLGPFTDKDLAERQPVDVKNGGLVSVHDLAPEPGGLFDPALVAGNKWGAVDLGQALPNPAFEKQIRQLLGIKESDLRNILAGTQELPERLR